MQKNLHPFWRVTSYLIVIHLLCLLFLSFCRAAFVWGNMPDSGIDWHLLPTAMLIGVKFDNLIASYISALPFVILMLAAVFSAAYNKAETLMPKIVQAAAWYYGVLYAPLLFLHIANVRYFAFFENHLNIGVTAWFGFVNETAGLLFKDAVNWIFFALAVVLIILFCICLWLLTKRYTTDWKSVPSAKRQLIGIITCMILFWGGIFCGIRGSFQRYPLRVSFAYFCNDPFYNKVGVNPLFNIIKSAEYGATPVPKEIQAIDEKEALHYVQEQLHFTPVDSLRPLVRKGTTHRMLEGRPNVVLVFMESMAADNMERKENGQWLTPYLRSLREKSIWWSNCYSVGVHTNNGIVGVHYGFLPNFAKPSMDVIADLYTGMPYYLQKNGYSTMCFITGNPQYDNMNSFWRDNHIEEIYSQYDYPQEKVVNNFGVQDEYLFEWGLDKLSERSKEDKPFFASFLTVSNHGPFVVPDEFKSRAKLPKDQIIAYADDAIRKFMEKASRTDWGKNTIFILVADHGASSIPHMAYDMPLSYNYIPVFICSEMLVPQQITRPASQIDIWVSLLSMLGIEYENNSLGIDIFSEERKYAFFCGNEHLGVSDGQWFWCYNLPGQQERLYKIGDENDVMALYPQQAAEMREYGMKMQRVNLMAIQNKWTEP